jgi:outer membrane receptor protein involved in Fe transport
LSFQLQGRYISGDKLNRSWVEGVDVDRNWVNSSTWWNATVRYNGEFASGATWNVGLNVLNLTDKAPPMIPGTAGYQSVSNTYDVFGRRYNLSLNMQF